MAPADLLVLDPTGERARLLLAARAAPVAIAAYLASFVAFVVLGDPGPSLAALGAATSLVLALALAAMAMGFAELTFSRTPRATSVVATLGVVAGLAAAALSVAMMASAGPAAIAGTELAFAALGAWLVGANALALGGGIARWQALAGIAAGLAFSVGAIFAGPGTQAGAVVAIVGGLSLGMPLWAWGARRAMLAAAVDPRRAAVQGVNA